MCMRTWAWLFGGLGFIGLFAAGANAQIPQPPPPTGAQTVQPPSPTEGVQVLTRGPVHEAFAGVVNVSPTPAPIVPKQPPEPIPELPPDQKPAGENVQWIPGYWGWDQDQADFVWVSGIWRVPPPNQQWVPGHWQQVPGGWQWIAGLWMPLGQTDIQMVPPPPPPPAEAAPPPAPDATSTYMPGIWVYQNNRYLWRPGFWVAYNPDWLWIPAHYIWVPSGCVFVEGFWDYPLANRGLLFAPVRIARQLWTRPNWFFTPRYVVNTQTLLESLFVGPAHRNYYFGDYFDPRYQKLGFAFWANYHINRHAEDVLFGYYSHRPGGAVWARELRDWYAGQHRGERPLPPRTFVQQNQVIQNLNRERRVDRTAINRVTVVHPLNEAGARRHQSRARSEGVS